MKQFFGMIVVLLLAVNVSAQNQCGLNVQGGVDIFPWGLAEPFPWNTIQGLWKVTDNNETIIKFRVTRSDTESKKLSVEVFSRQSGKCDKPLMTGFGIITAEEKNIVRVSLKDSTGSIKLLTLAWFNAQNLKLTGPNCDRNVLVAAMIPLVEDASHKDAWSQEVEAPQMMLKKITGSLDFYCKKRK